MHARNRMPEVKAPMHLVPRRLPSLSLCSAAFLAALAQPSCADDQGWAPSVHAVYTLRYNGIGVGRLDISSRASASAYSVSGSGKVSAFFGLITWTGASSVSGTIDHGMPVPSSYALDWRKNSKGGRVALRFSDRKATSVTVDPPSGDHPDTVPLKPEHMAGALDPLSAVLILTRADSRAPCDRRAEIFDGKQRYDLVFTLKRHIRIASPKSGGPSQIGFVCRADYQPIAGHRDNDTTKGYAANHETEVVMRPVPGTKFMIPYSVSVPTPWGTGSMTTEHIDVTTPQGIKVALTD